MPPGDDDDDSVWYQRVPGTYSGNDGANTHTVSILSDYTIDVDSSAISTDAIRLAAEAISRRDAVDVSESKLMADLRSERRKLNTKDNVQMDANSLETWFVEQALDYFQREEVGEMCAEGGFPQIRHAVLEEESESVHNEYQLTDDWIRAFNNVTMEWPHDARAYLAAYEYRYQDHDADSYREQLEEFAEAVGVMEYNTTMQSELEWFHGENPYHDENLTDPEAKAVLILRANDEPEDIITDVESADNFIGWYKKTGDADSARRACRFDADIPEQLAPELADPDEWDELDPDNIESGMCAICGNDHYHVRHHEVGEAWVGADGQAVDEAYPFSESALSVDGGSGDLLCGQCYTSWESEEHIVTMFDGDDVFKLGKNRGITKDYGQIDDTDYLPAIDAGPTGATILEDAFGGAPEDYFELQPTDRASASRDDQSEALYLLLEDPTIVFEQGPVFIRQRPHFSGDEAMLYLPRDIPQVAQRGKEVLENADEIVDENTDSESDAESEEGLGELFA
jgi:hypothetical protein